MRVSRRGKARLDLRVLQRRVLAPVEDVRLLPVAVGGHVVGPAEEVRVLAEQRLDLRAGPDVEAPLHTLAVGVQRAGEAAADALVRGRHHLAQDPGHRLPHPLLVERLARLLPDERQHVDQRRVVVEHLFEVRDEPLVVHRIAREAAAQMVVDAALAHLGERVRHRRPERLAPRVEPAPPEEFHDPHLRELRRLADAAPGRVDLAQQAVADLGHRLLVDDGAGAVLRQTAERLAQCLDVPADLVRLLRVGVGDAPQHVRKPRPAPAARSSRSTLMFTNSAFIWAAMASSSKLSCAMTWHQWQAA
jgi:hypothetical protein